MCARICVGPHKIVVCYFGYVPGLLLLPRSFSNVSAAGRPRSYCFATDPFLVGITSASAVPALFLARSLRNAYDAFGIRQELERVLWIEIICGGTSAR